MTYSLTPRADKQSGFTIIELIVVIVVLATAALVFFAQKNNVEIASRDDQRKTAINAMYYSLEESFYKKNGYYPSTINDNTLPSMDAALLSDPTGKKLGDSSSNYRYLPTNCDGDKCKSYTLRASLENEADFVKTSRNN